MCARERGLKVIIAGEHGATHLAGVAAAFPPLPNIGVPMKCAGKGASNDTDGLHPNWPVGWDGPL
jgi:phosphoribosylcarboxyaminoimidazole (NCAIR) mutase